MVKVKATWLSCLILLTCIFSNLCRAELAEGFLSPPKEAQTWVYWWWLNGHVSKDGIVRDLDAMRELGISGALVFHAGSGKTPSSTEFMSRAWREYFRFAVEEAAKRGITIGLNLCGGWNAGGPWVKPEDGVKVLVHSTKDVRGPMNFQDALPHPAPQESTYHEVAVLAWPLDENENLQSEGFLDLTKKMDPQGNLAWKVPAGQWRVVRFGWKVPKRGYTKTTGGTRELEIDPLSAAAMDRHFAATAGVVIKDVAPHVGKTFKFVHIDSGEIGHPDWTPSLRDDFQRLRGYDPFPYLAAKAGQDVDSAEVTERFLEDYEQTIGDLTIECYYGRLGELAHSHGLGTHSEAAGYQKPSVDALRALGCNDICMSEYWSRKSPRYIHQLAESQLYYHDGIKNAASAAHIYGRKIVQAEAFTVIRGTNYDRSLFELKDIGDRAFCAGLNRNVLHQFMCQADEQSQPGYVWPHIGTEFDRHSTLWPMGSAWFTYLARCQYLLQPGRFVGDVCYLLGEWVPAYMPAKWAMDPPLPPGYDCDTINAEALIERATVDDNGRLVLPGGQSYRYLVLWQGGRWQQPPRSLFESDAANVKAPKCPATGSAKPLVLSPETLKKVKALVEAGVTLVGPHPMRSPGLTGYPASDVTVKALADSLWGANANAVGNRKVGNGRVIWGRSLSEVMRADGVLPDVEIRESQTTKAVPKETLSGIPNPGTFGWIHREVGEADVYFIANLRNASASATFTFRIREKQPELWDAVTGKTRDAVAFDQTADGRTTLPLEFPPRGSLFVVFRKAIPASQNGLAKKNSPHLVPAMEISGPWNVQFDSAWGGPKSAIFNRLEEWTRRPEPGIKYYSGTATYRKTFHLPKSLRQGKEPMYLNLGTVHEIAQIRLNGKNLGTVWTSPWRVEITDAVKPTDNQLEIDVANLWTNRLVGDAGLLPEERRTTTNVTSFKKDSPLLPSGLLGPVNLLTAEKP
jgi:hypothetical protein